MERKSTVKRATSETDITVELILESSKKSTVESGVGFFDHMLISMSKHGRFYMKLICKGDNEIDDHHSVEDIGIILGAAFKKALGDKSGIRRFGDAAIPMDDVLTLVAIDLSGRPFYKYSGPEMSGYIGKFSEELTDEFLRSFAINSGINLHVNVFYGQNKHHIHETIYKALGIALWKASLIDDFLGSDVLSTKGVI